MALMWALLISACGGGGGSPGATPSNPTGTDTGTLPNARAASIVITTSSDTLAAAGGNDVTVNVLVKDANNNVVPDATINLSADSGTLSRNNVDRKTDKSGLVTEVLDTKGNSAERTITITASVGSVAPVTKQVKVVAARPTLQLTASSGVLDSSGAVGNEVTITATVRDPSNNVMKGQAVTLSATSGSLTNGGTASGVRTTNDFGVVTEKLSTGGDATARTITVTAVTPGAVNAEMKIQVAGHKIQITSNESANANKVSKITAVLTDAGGKPIVGKPVTFSAQTNTGGLSVSGTGAKDVATTDSQGQVQLDFLPSKGPSDVITVSSLGVSASRAITVNTLNFTVMAVKLVNGTDTPITTANIGTGAAACIKFIAHADDGNTPLSGVMTLNSSRGIVYDDANCLVPLLAAKPLDANHNVVAYVQATSPGIASLVANLSGSVSATASSELEFVAPLTNTTHVSLQVDPAVVGTGKPSTLKAVVRDGTALDNLVKNATVVFSIAEDPSGGVIALPSVVKTDADGSASVVYTSGLTTTAVGGVKLKAQIQDAIANVPGNTGVSATASLTVSGQSLFISAGTGNTLGGDNQTVYTLDYAVFVTDASGNAVNNATVTARVVPREYTKGSMSFSTLQGRWDIAAPSFTCPNEDKNGNGVLDTGEDANGSGRLEPGIPVTVTTSQTTNAAGMAKITLTYPRDRAYWTSIDMIISARVVGTEATYLTYTVLPGLTTDYNKSDTRPPGQISPYGRLDCPFKD